MLLAKQIGRLAVALLGVILFSTAAYAQKAHRLRGLVHDITVAAEQSLLEPTVTGDAGFSTPSLKGVRLTAVHINDDQIIELDFSKELLAYSRGELEQVLDGVLHKIGDVTGALNDGYMVLVEGTPLHELFADADGLAAAAVAQDSERSQQESERKGAVAAVTTRAATSAGPLAGKRVVISPGHGWYWLESCSCWRLQRSYFWGIVEDFVNAEMVMYLNGELGSTGADVRPTREMNKSAGTGETGHAKWEEDAKYYVKAKGAPSSVWNYGGSDLDKDIDSRPLYANWVGADVMVSLHNNGSVSTGTETWYDNTNGQADKSKQLAQAIHNKVLNAIRQNYNSKWADRGVKGSNSYGENRLAKMPAVVIEVAFMDTKSPDNDALHDERFKQLVAKAINEGIQAYLGVTTAPSTGTLQVNATLNGNSSWTGAVNCQINGPAGFSLARVPATLPNMPTGQYSLSCGAGGPGTLVSISPSSSQNLGSSETKTFTLNFVQETVTTPTLSGPTSGFTNTPYAFLGSGASSTTGSPLTYEFEWGDGTQSSVTSSSASHNWNQMGNFSVRVRARSTRNSSVVSAYSNAVTIQIRTPAPPLTATCSANPNPVKINKTITWQAQGQGGSGSYSYNWYNGTTTQTYSKSYSSPSTVSNWVTITDRQNGSSKTGYCSLTVTK